ncbi:MAG: hypothetical protein ISP90_18355 [Nevskia sp.]|nr:hypothetical protein [Nevskia sp.]
MPNKLPERCVSREPRTGRLVMLTRGKVGFTYIAGSKTPDEYNRAAGLTYEQVEAMEYGALLGFDGELADPDYVREVRLELGRPIGLIQDPHELPRMQLLPRSERPPKLHQPTDVGNFLPEFADVIDKRKRPSWG